MRVARIFAGDLIDFLEDTQRAKRDVFEIADRCADKIKASVGCGIPGVCRLWGNSLRAHADESNMR